MRQVAKLPVSQKLRCPVVTCTPASDSCRPRTRHHDTPGAAPSHISNRLTPSSVLIGNCTADAVAEAERAPWERCWVDIISAEMCRRRNTTARTIEKVHIRYIVGLLQKPNSADQLLPNSAVEALHLTTVARWHPEKKLANETSQNSSHEWNKGWISYTARGDRSNVGGARAELVRWGGLAVEWWRHLKRSNPVLRGAGWSHGIRPAWVINGQRG